MSNINADFVRGVTELKRKKELERTKKEDSGIAAADYTLEAAGIGTAAGLALGKANKEFQKYKFKKKMAEGREKKSFKSRPLNAAERELAPIIQEKRKSVKDFKISMSNKDKWDIMNMPQGIDMVGEQHGGNFVKAGKRDIPQRMRLTKKMREMGNFIRRKGRPISFDRQNDVNRVFIQEALGPMGADTWMHRTRKGGPVTIIQEPLQDISREQAYGIHKNQGLYQGAARRQGVHLRDAHYANWGNRPDGTMVIRDVGHSGIADLEKLTSDPKLRKAVNLKNIMSPHNRALTMKYAKEQGAKFAKGLKGAGLKSLPFVGPAMAAYTALEHSPAQAMYDMEPSGSSPLNQSTYESKKHFEEQRRFNTLRKLKQFGGKPFPTEQLEGHIPSQDLY